MEPLGTHSPDVPALCAGVGLVLHLHAAFARGSGVSDDVLKGSDRYLIENCGACIYTCNLSLGGDRGGSSVCKSFVAY